MTASRCSATSICRPARGRFPRLLPPTAAGGRRAHAVRFNSGDPISPAAAMCCSRSATAWRRRDRKCFRRRSRTCSRRCSSCAAARERTKSNPGASALFAAPPGGRAYCRPRLAGGSAVFKNAYPNDAHAAVSSKVKALIGVYGVYDLVEMWQRYQLQSPRENNIENFMGCAPMDDPQRYFDASPINYATFANNQIGVFLSVGTEDDLVNRRGPTDALPLRLKQAKFFVRPSTLQGAPHYWINDPIEEPVSYSGFLAPRLLRFLQERL